MESRPHETGIQRMSRPRLYEQVVHRIIEWIEQNQLAAGDRLPPERELAGHLGVSRATLSQALVAMEVTGVVTVRHGDGAVIRTAPRSGRISSVIRLHAQQLDDVLDAREALETKTAALAASRRTDDDLDAIEAALTEMDADIRSGSRGIGGDEAFHHAVTAASHSLILIELMGVISELIRETRVEAWTHAECPADGLVQHRAIAAAIAAGAPDAASAAMHLHLVSVRQELFRSAD